MTDQLPPPPAAVPAAPADDLGLDRALVMSLARVPLIAVAWVAAAWAVSALVGHMGWLSTFTDSAGEPVPVNVGPLAVICGGMLLAAFIDGYAFKVPNWCTLSLVVSGWYLGLLHDSGVPGVPGEGGVLAALGGTALGFAFLFPALLIGGMGEGDVKMTMGFGSWMGAFFGLGVGASFLWWSFAIGVLVGGVFGVVIMLARRQFGRNLANAREIMTDLQVLVTQGPEAASKRANTRRKDWVRLPYGVPLCVGFLGYLWLRFFVTN